MRGECSKTLGRALLFSSEFKCLRDFIMRISAP